MISTPPRERRRYCSSSSAVVDRDRHPIVTAGPPAAEGLNDIALDDLHIVGAEALGGETPALVTLVGIAPAAFATVFSDVLRGGST